MKNACRSLAVVALLALVATATAGIRRMAPETVRKQVEVTMLLTRTIDIEHDGSVSGYALDQPEKVPDYVASLLDRRVRLAVRADGARRPGRGSAQPHERAHGRPARGRGRFRSLDQRRQLRQG